MDSIYVCFVLIVALMTIIACLKSNQVEHFIKFKWNSCIKPNEWVEKHCWKQRVWKKKKKVYVKQKRCNIYCEKPKFKVEPKATCAFNSSGGSNARGNTHYLVKPAKLEIEDSMYKQKASFVFNDDFASPTLDFDDVYNKVELLDGGKAKVCRKNYNELCRGDPNKCKLLSSMCVTLNDKNPNMDFRLTDHKIGQKLKNDLSSVKIVTDTGNTRVRLSEPNNSAVKKRVPNELIVHHADKLAWNDAVSNFSFDSGKVILHNDPWHKGPNTTYNTAGDHEIEDRQQKRKANAIRYYFKS